MAERKIAGKTYRVSPMTCADALALYTDIMRIVGPAAPRLPAIIVSLSSDDEGQNMLADVAALTAVSDILSRVPTSEVVGLVRRIVETAEVSLNNGKNYDPIEMDLEFTGHLSDLIPVARFVLEEQFRDFFTGSRKGGILSLLSVAFQNRKSAA